MDKLPQLFLGCALLGLGYFLGLSSSSTRVGSHHASLVGQQQAPSFTYVRSAEELLSMDPLSRVVLSLPAWVFAAPDATPLELAPPTPPSTEARALMTAQDYEDKDAHRFYFAGVRGGLVLESGALNGVMFSVSNFFCQGAGLASHPRGGLPLLLCRADRQQAREPEHPQRPVLPQGAAALCPAQWQG